MLYYGNPSSDAVLQLMAEHTLGFMATPAQRNPRPAGVLWAADNGCYGKGWPGIDRWLAWLNVQRQTSPELCAFASAPDVVGDWEATWERSRVWLPELRDLGYRAAVVAQDGLTVAGCPWGEFDVLFIGGTTEWKLGPVARALVAEARERGLYVHMGRVNTGRRFRYAATIGCHSADGTTFAKFPDASVPRLRAWLDEHDGSLHYWAGHP